jgi:hypothetical protein
MKAHALKNRAPVYLHYALANECVHCTEPVTHVSRCIESLRSRRISFLHCGSLSEPPWRDSPNPSDADGSEEPSTRTKLSDFVNGILLGWPWSIRRDMYDKRTTNLLQMPEIGVLNCGG